MNLELLGHEPKHLARDQSEVLTKCLSCHTNKKGMAYVTSSGQVAEMVTCSRPSQTDVIFVGMDALADKVFVEDMHYH